jgi:hypothetical protein
MQEVIKAKVNAKKNVVDSTVMAYIGHLLKVYRLDHEFNPNDPARKEPNYFKNTSYTPQIKDSLTKIYDLLNNQKDATKSSRKDADRRDYANDMVNLFEMEAMLRQTKPDSDEHFAFLLMTLFCFSRPRKTDKGTGINFQNLTFVPRLNDYFGVQIVDGTIDTTPDQVKAYNVKDGRLVMKGQETGKRTATYPVDYYMCTRAQELIQKHYDKRVVDAKGKNKATLMGTITKPKFTKYLNAAQATTTAEGGQTKKIELGNRWFRRVYENTFQHVMIPRVGNAAQKAANKLKMAKVMSHDVATAEATYLTNQHYDATEIETYKAKLKKLFKQKT